MPYASRLAQALRELIFTHVLAIALFVWFMLAIIGMQLLGGALQECTDSLTPVAECVGAGLNTTAAVYNFDTLPNSLLTLLALFKLDNWPSQVWLAAKQTRRAGGGELLELATVAYFIVFIFCGSIIVTSLYLAILVVRHTRPRARILSRPLLAYALR